MNVRRGWGDELARAKNREVAHALDVASRHAAAEARRVASARRRAGDDSVHMSDITAARVVGTVDGWEGGFKSPAWYSGFQSRGTVGARKVRLKASTLRRRNSKSGSTRFARVSGSSGIRPLYHEEKGLAAGKKLLKQMLDRL